MSRVKPKHTCILLLVLFSLRWESLEIAPAGLEAIILLPQPDCLDFRLRHLAPGIHFHASKRQDVIYNPT